MNERASKCVECGVEIDWEGEGGIIFAGDTFCETHDPLEPVYCGDHIVSIDECGCKI